MTSGSYIRGEGGRDIALASKIGARGTPNFRINGKALVGAQPFEKFEELIDEQLAAAAALAKTGIPASEISGEIDPAKLQARRAGQDASDQPTASGHDGLEGASARQ